MIRLGAATILTAIVVPLFAVGYQYTKKVDLLEERQNNRKEVIEDIKEDLKEIKSDIKTLLNRRK